MIVPRQTPSHWRFCGYLHALITRFAGAPDQTRRVAVLGDNGSP